MADRRGSRRRSSDSTGLVIGIVAVTAVVAGTALFMTMRAGESERKPRTRRSDAPTATEDRRHEGGSPARDTPPPEAAKTREPVGTPVTPPDETDRTPAARSVGTSGRPDDAAELEGPYEDRLQQQIRFGERSYYLSPWRAYMDTWPASRYLEVLGCVFNGVSPEEADAVAEVLAGAGIRQVRIEVGWGSFDYDDPTRLKPHDERGLRAGLAAVRKHGIRPLILLNANSGWPCPIRSFRVKLLRDAEKGARELFVDGTDRILPGHTGLRGQAYQVAFPLVTGIDAATGQCELSAPLTKPLEAGGLDLFTLKYRPFAGVVFADGTPNPAAAETFDGWMKYVAGICRTCKSALGTEGEPDAGFDLEVWNEYTFGSQFLEDRNYHDPDREFSQPFVYRNHGREKKGHESILPMTVDYVNDPERGLPGVRVIDGFSNQRPWESGSGMWPGQAGFSRHYYTGIRTWDRFDGLAGLLGPGTDRNEKSGPLDALGKRDGDPDGKDWHTVVPGTFFQPKLAVSMPEAWHFGYKTEFMTRDVQPFPGPWRQHHRYSHPGDRRIAQVWMTEFNIDRGPWAGRLAAEAGCGKDDPRLAALMHRVAARATLRTFVFHGHKGVHTITMYNSKESDTGLGVIPTAFFRALGAAGHRLTDEVRSLAGPQLEVIGRVTKLMRTGEAIGVTRRLRVEKLLERAPRLVFRGDGTPGHPDRWHRDDFACLPFQLAADRYAVGYYVVTRNIVKSWNEERDLLDPARYDMPPQEFDLTLGNVRGEGATVSAWDPMTDRELPVRKLGATVGTLTVRLSTVDYPRFLVIKESRPGPMILKPRLARSAKGARPRAATVAFATNVEASASVTWGPFPDRKGAPGGPLRRPATRGHQTVEIGSMDDGDAVRITVEHDGLVARWPNWDWDVQGVLAPAGGAR